LARSKKKLANNEFLNRAPEDVVAKERDKFQRLADKLNKLQRQLERLRKIKDGG
jgi:valyl-tRNA synthetase